MLDEDFCPCSSPDLWKEALDCQDLAETQALDGIIQENTDDEIAEETRDDSFDDSDATRAGSDDDVVPNSHNNSKAKSPIKSTSPSTSIRSSQLVTPVQVERKISQVQNNNNVLRQEYASRNGANNNKNEYIISESSESDSDTSIDKKPLQGPSVRNEANSKMNVNSSDSETGGFNEAQTVSAKSASQSLKDKKNLENNSAVDDSSDDSFNEAQTLSAKSASQFLRDKENLKNNSLLDNKPSVSKPAGQPASFSNEIQNNNSDLDDEIEQWLEENNNETQWAKTRNDLRAKHYTDWEERCMLYYLLKTNTMDQCNSKKNWDLMKIKYKYTERYSVYVATEKGLLCRKPV
ncbi:hypothetical protein KQX54_005723 [Cotesia glomerata]|uniref:Uncharacterized protein n=2 Tax=Cotesia glomerata TaxID=32391 RepID=A0AAV7IL74_COTGL|nr:hypothetical protein KQX54_005723 [Cotesia glomerata]